MLALRNESDPRLNVDPKEALRVPDALRRINVFGHFSLFCAALSDNLVTLAHFAARALE